MTVRESFHQPILIAVAALAVGVLPDVAFATNGYLIHGIGTRTKAMAGAGVALPLDALAPGTNPAGLAFIGKRYDLGVGLFSPRREFTVKGAPTGFPGTFGLLPGTVESDSELFVVPNFGAAWERPSGQHLGLAVYGQGGMNTDYPRSVFFGSSPTGVDLSQLFIVPTWAARSPSGRHAFGVSPILAYQSFEAQGVQAFGGFSSDPANLSNKGHDDSTGFGVKLGYLGQVTDRFSVGLSWQSEIGMDAFSSYSGLFAGQGDFDIPSNWVAGIAYRFGANASLALDYQQINYSDVPSVSNQLLPNLLMAPLGGANGAGFGWQDMEVIKAGVQWGDGSPWTWRAGFSTGDQPIPESEVLFNILAPGVMEEHITFGFSRAAGKGEFSMAVMYAPSVSVEGLNPLEAPIPGQQRIELQMTQWDVEFGYSWGF